MLSLQWHYVGGHQTHMMTSPNWNVSALLALCVGNSPVTGEFASQRPVTRGFDVFFDLSLKKRLSKQFKRRWFETLSHSLWRHSNGMVLLVGINHDMVVIWGLKTCDTTRDNNYRFSVHCIMTMEPIERHFGTIQKIHVIGKTILKTAVKYSLSLMGFLAKLC